MGNHITLADSDPSITVNPMVTYSPISSTVLTQIIQECNKILKYQTSKATFTAMQRG